MENLKFLVLNSQEVNNSKIYFDKIGAMQFEPYENAIYFRTFYSKLVTDVAKVVTRLLTAPDEFKGERKKLFHYYSIEALIHRK